MPSHTTPSEPLRLYFTQPAESWHQLPEWLKNARSAEPITQALLGAVEEGEVVGQSLGPQRITSGPDHYEEEVYYTRMCTVTLRLGEVEVALLIQTKTNDFEEVMTISKKRRWILSTVELYLTHPANRWSELDEVWRRCSAALEGLDYRESSLLWGRGAFKIWQLAQSLADDDQFAALGKRWVQAVLDDTKYNDGGILRPMPLPYRALTVPHMPAEWIEQVLQDPRVIEQCMHLDLQYLQSRSLPAGVRHLKALESLDLSQSKISTLPEWLGELTQLWKISIWRTPLKRKKKKIEAQLAAILPDCELRG